MSKENLQCDHCDRIFTTIKRLEYHISCYHSDKNKEEHHCSFCDYKSSLKGNLKKHLVICKEKIKQEECDDVSKKYIKMIEGKDIEIKLLETTLLDKESKTEEKQKIYNQDMKEKEIEIENIKQKYIQLELAYKEKEKEMNQKYIQLELAYKEKEKEMK